ncbi:hypothetical protein E4N71_11125 [Treponema vincentii]|uniref:hypothetical protein n=1 Tax=Treponema vincentii TaxID=69710 RepID=UPI003D8C9E45
MDGANIIYQSFRPKISIYASSKDFITDNPTYVFSDTSERVLQSYNFSYSRNNLAGSFSLTFFPETDTVGKAKIFDNVHTMDIVKISEFNRIVFVGIVKSKKYVTQVNESGAIRRLSINGIAATGLLSLFYINLDTSACALTQQYKTQESLRTALTLENAGADKPVSDIVQNIWKCFLEISSQLGTPKIAEYINDIMGAGTSFFLFDDSKFHYPLGCVFDGERTQDFFSLVDKLIPEPIYEKVPCIENGKMKVKIRQCPFDADTWSRIKPIVINKGLVKDFEVTQSDSEVYTVFYAYLDGYPISEEKALRLSTIKDTAIDTTLQQSDKFKLYGYRPLMAHFIGYGTKDGESDSNTASAIESMSKKLKAWYENLPDMLSGNITMPLTDMGINPPMPGDIVSFLKGSFYVEGVTHSWNYGAGGEVNISVSRGGIYKNGKFSKYDGITDKIAAFEEKNE